MMIQSDAELRQYIPNALVTVSGEQTLFDKLQGDLQLSEAWLARTFGVVESTPTACKVLATDAFMRAIPSLDLVLTPNGFGIVSNNTIAPASKDRVDRLIASLEHNRDFAIDQLLQTMLQQPEWRATAHGRYFLSTLFQTPLSLPAELRKQHALDVFQQTHAQLVLIESELAEKFISREVYAKLRADIGNPDYADLVQPLQAIELQLLAGNPLPYKQLIALVDYIRKSELFPEWQNTETARLYEPRSFKNSKQSGGYWW